MTRRICDSPEGTAERAKILAYLRGVEADTHANAPPALGGLPAPIHHKYWGRWVVLEKVIEAIEQGEHLE